MFQDVHEDDSCHVGVVRGLVIVRQQGLPIVVVTLVFGVEAPPQVPFELVIVNALFVDLSQRGVVEGSRVVSQHFCVVGEGEARIPLLRELDVGLREWTNELVVEVKPVVHAIVPNHGLFGLDHGLYDEREAHLVDEKLLLSALLIDLVLNRIGLRL